MWYFLPLTKNYSIRTEQYFHCNIYLTYSLNWINNSMRKRPSLLLLYIDTDHLLPSPCLRRAPVVRALPRLPSNSKGTEAMEGEENTSWRRWTTPTTSLLLQRMMNLQHAPPYYQLSLPTIYSSILLLLLPWHNTLLNYCQENHFYILSKPLILPIALHEGSNFVMICS